MINEYNEAGSINKFIVQANQTEAHILAAPQRCRLFIANDTDRLICFDKDLTALIFRTNYGTGTTNYIMKYTDGALGLSCNSGVYDTGSAIGIGTTDPMGQVHITERLLVGIGDSSMPLGNIGILQLTETGYPVINMRSETDEALYIRNDHGNAIHTNTGNVVIEQNAFISGNVGIGTTSTAYKLNVDGDINIYETKKIKINGLDVLSTISSVYNLFIGNSGNATATGTYNYGIGYETLRNVTVGYGNIAIGSNCLQADTTGHKNIAIGSEVLLSNTTGDGNIGLGVDVLRMNVSGLRNFGAGPNTLHSNISGSYLIAIGANALYSNTTGDGNVAFGFNALQYNTTGSNNFALGANALLSNTSGANNFAAGVNSLYANTTGYGNVAIGAAALQNNTAGYYNFGFGPNALFSNTTGIYNISVGINSLYANTTGYANVAIGNSALQSNTTGYYNFGIGPSALLANTTGYNNVAIGIVAAMANVSGIANVAIGNYSLLASESVHAQASVGAYSLTAATGGGNSALGCYAGGTLISGTNNVFVGYNAGYSVLQKTDATNCIVIGYGAYSTESNKVILGNSSITKTALFGSVGIGTTNPSYAVHIIGEEVRHSYGGVSTVLRAYNSYNLGAAYLSAMNDAGDKQILIQRNGTAVAGTSCGLTSANLGVISNSSGNDLLISQVSTYGIHFANNDAVRMTIRGSDGYVGVGTTNPGYPFEVIGNVNISSGSYYKVNGANLSYANVGAAPAYTLTPNYIPKASTPATDLVDTNMYATSNRVGIGTSSLTSTFVIYDTPAANVALAQGKNGSNADFIQGVHVLAPNLSSGRHITGINVGIEHTTKQDGYLGFYYAGEGSDSNAITLGFYGTTDLMILNAAGNVGIGTTAPTTGYKLEVLGKQRVAAADTGLPVGYFVNTAVGTSSMHAPVGLYGEAENSGGLGYGYGVEGYGKTYDFYALVNGYGEASSRRWKKEVAPVLGALDKILQLQGVTYRTDKTGSRDHIGLVAEDVGKIFPELVQWEDEEKTVASGLNYTRLIPILIEAVKEIYKKIK